MKRLLLIALLIIGLAGISHAAPNYRQKRQNLAIAAMQADIQLIDALIKLKQIQRERNSLPNGEDFKDEDFIGSSSGILNHMDAALVIDFIENIAPQFTALYENNAPNRNVMNKMKP